MKIIDIFLWRIFLFCATHLLVSIIRVWNSVWKNRFTSTRTTDLSNPPHENKRKLDRPTFLVLGVTANDGSHSIFRTFDNRRARVRLWSILNQRFIRSCCRTERFPAVKLMKSKTTSLFFFISTESDRSLICSVSFSFVSRSNRRFGRHLSFHQFFTNRQLGKRFFKLNMTIKMTITRRNTTQFYWSLFSNSTTKQISRVMFLSKIRLDNHWRLSSSTKRGAL